MKKILGLVLVLAILAPAALAAERPMLRADVRVDERGARSGVMFDLISISRAKRPTKTVYREEAVSLWRAQPGQLVAAATAPGTVSDVNAAVETKEVVVEKSLLEAAGDHLRRNAGKYVAGAVAAVAGGVGYAIYDANKDDGGKAAPAPAPAAPADARQSPTIAVTAGDGSPVTVNLTITAMPPE